MKKKDSSPLSGYLLTLCIAAGLALSIRTWVIEPYQISNSSMKPTLLAGDTLFVWKWPFRKKGNYPQLQRGELIAFSLPPPTEEEPKVNYIRRIIGLPGDRVELKAGHLIVNGQPLQIQNPKPKDVENSDCSFEKLSTPSLTFTVCADPTQPATISEQKVPENFYLALGDWRTRIKAEQESLWTLVPTASIQGQPWVVWLSVDYSHPKGLLPHLRWERLFQKIE